MRVYTVMSTFTQGSLFLSEQPMNTGDRVVKCAMSDKEIDVETEYRMGKSRWYLKQQDGGSFLLENAQIQGSALYCSQYIDDIDDQLCFPVGLSSWDQRDGDEYPNKWRWDVVWLPDGGVQIVNKMSKNALSVSDSPCNEYGDRYVYTLVGPSNCGLKASCIFQLVERSKIFFVPRVITSA